MRRNEVKDCSAHSSVVLAKHVLPILLLSKDELNKRKDVDKESKSWANDKSRASKT